MKIVHFIRITVFDDSEEIYETLKTLFPFDITKLTTNKKAMGFNDREIITYTVDIKRSPDVKAFLNHLMPNLSELKETLLNQLESRLDEDLHFFIRLDKENLKNDIYKLTDSGNCFHIKMSIATFPKRRETAIEILKEILS